MKNRWSLKKCFESLLGKDRRHVLLLALIAVLSFGLNFFAISKAGYGNAYYAAAIKSMTQSFKNFFFVSFDPAGLVSVDKPPLALWIQTLFVLLFGYHGWAMLLPQALAGTGSCIMLYILTAKYFGRRAGLLSSLLFAITPAVVVASRNNTMDMQLIFVLLAATWFLFRSIEKSKWRYLFTAALFVGLGFNIKMLQAYMILPAVAVIYLLFSKEKLVKRLIAGLISIVIMATVSFAWVVAVDLYPSGSRPYVDSSSNNTVLELIIGHNGMERIYGQGMGGGQGQMTNGRNPGNGQNGGNQGGFGQQGGSGGSNQPSGQSGGPTGTQQSGTFANPSAGNSPAQQNGGQMPSGPAPSGMNGGPAQGNPGGGNGKDGGMGGIGSGEIGNAGALRLWSTNLYGQASWLIIFALFGILAHIKKFSLKRLTLKQGVFAYWIIWLATMYAFFSFAGFYHRYYLCMLAPAVAVLSGTGLIKMADAFKSRHGLRSLFLPLAFLSTLTVELIYVWSYSALRVWLFPIMAAAGVVTLGCMAAYYFTVKRFLSIVFQACMLISILAAPFYWALTPVMYVPNSTMPFAGPELASQSGGGNASQRGGAPSQSGSKSPSEGTSATGKPVSSALEQYLVRHYQQGSYLVVSQRSDDVAQFIIDTGLPAVAYGGFLGSDNAISLTRFKELVKEGKITYFLVSGQGGFGNFQSKTGSASDNQTKQDTSGQSETAQSEAGQSQSMQGVPTQGKNSGSEIISYVEKNATLINASEYGGSSQGGSLYCFKS